MTVDIAAIHAAYPTAAHITTYLVSHGCVTRNGNIACPLPTHPDNQPSAHIYDCRDGIARLRCFACDFSGDIVDIARALGDQHLLDTHTTTPPPPVSQHVGSPDHHYWHNRGISSDTVLKLRLHQGTGPHAGRHAVPYLDRNGLITAIRSRAHTDTPPRWFSPAGQPSQMWRSPASWDAELVVLTEGESDAIAAVDAGFASVAIPGVATWKPQWATEFAQKWVLVCGDGDPAGHKFASKVVDDLHAAGIKAWAPPLPDNHDLADLHRQGELCMWLADQCEAWPSAYPRLLRIDEHTNIPETRWLIDDIIPIEGITIVGGPPGVGKSFFCEDLAAAVTANRPWMGHTPKRTGPTVILDWENPRTDIRYRQGQLDTPADLHWFQPASNLKDLGFIRELENMLSDLHPELVFFDSLFRAFPGIDVCDDPQLIPALILLDRLVRTADATGIVLHHANKSGANAQTRLTGSLQISGQCNAAWTLVNRGPQRFCYPAKTRSGPPQPGFEWLLDSSGFCGRGLALRRIGTAPPEREVFNTWR